MITKRFELFDSNSETELLSDSGELSERSDADEERLLRFLSLYNAYYKRMYLFAKTLMPVADDVDDIMQEASLTLWKKFPNFRIDTDFMAWAFSIIRIEVLRWQRKKALERKQYDEEFINAVAGKLMVRDEKDWDLRYDALVACTNRLTPRMRNLVLDRYFKKQSIKVIAERAQKSMDVVYQRLSRVRAFLKNCVTEKLGR